MQSISQHNCLDCGQPVSRKDATRCRACHIKATQPSIEDAFKRCSSCGISLPLNRFYKDKAQTSGLKCECKHCSAVKRGQPLRQLLLPNLRQCTKCQSILPVTAEYFFPHKSAPSGFCSWCKECHKERNRENLKRLRETDIELTRSKGREEYHAKHETRLTQMRAYYHRHHEEQLIRNREKRARRLQAPGTHTAADIALLYEQSEDCCMYCGIRLFGDYHVDHIEPLARGGSNWPDNLTVACADCNLSKSDKLPTEWQVVRGW